MPEATTPVTQAPLPFRSLFPPPTTEDERRAAWRRIEEVARNGDIIEGLVVARVQGGLSVDIGVRAFLPGSEIAVRPIRRMETLIGQFFPLRIQILNPLRGHVVVSRRRATDQPLEIPGP